MRRESDPGSVQVVPSRQVNLDPGSDSLPVAANVARLRASVQHLLPAPLDPQALTLEARAWLARNKKDSLRPNTLKAIVVSHRYWAAWYGLRYAMEMTLPLSVPTVLQFLVDHAGRAESGQLAPQLPAAIDAALMADGCKAHRVNPETKAWEPVPWKLSTFKQRLATMSILHALRSLPNPFTDPEVRDQLRRITRIAHDAGQGPKGQEAATRDVMRALSDACTADGSPRAVRDRALLWFGFASGGRRRSEITSARYAQLRRDGAEYLFLMATSKTNKTGEPEVKPIFGLAAHHLTAWLELRGTWSGPLFCRLTRDGTPVRGDAGAMSTEMVRLAIRHWAGRAGLSQTLSAHSLRSGFLTQAGIDGVHPADAMNLSGHKTQLMLTRYYRVGELKKSKAARLAGEAPMGS